MGHRDIILPALQNATMLEVFLLWRCNVVNLCVELYASWNARSANIYLNSHRVQPQHNTNTEHTHYHTNYQTTNYKIKAL